MWKRVMVSACFTCDRLAAASNQIDPLKCTADGLDKVAKGPLFKRRLCTVLYNACNSSKSTGEFLAFLQAGDWLVSLWLPFYKESIRSRSFLLELFLQGTCFRAPFIGFLEIASALPLERGARNPPTKTGSGLKIEEPV